MNVCPYGLTKWFVRLAVLVSGSGTILRAMFDAGLPVTVVVSDRPCAALDMAGEKGTAAALVDRAEFGGFGSNSIETLSRRP